MAISEVSAADRELALAEQKKKERTEVHCGELMQLLELLKRHLPGLIKMDQSAS